MRRFMVAIALPVIVAAVLATPGTATASAGGIGLVGMTGAQEVPRAGDPAGIGLFGYVTAGHLLCYALLVRGIAPATAAHIHVGRRGIAGPVVVALQTPAAGPSVACITAVPDSWQNPTNATTTLTVSELRAITSDPAGFYANVHTTNYPAGALRGQLR